MRRYLVLQGILAAGCNAFASVAIAPRAAPRAAPSSESSLLHIGRARRGRSLAAVNAGSAEDWSKLTVPELKDKLRERGLAVGGRKNDLIERLVTERNIVDESPGDLSASTDEPQSPVLQSEKENLSQLTVPALKERLKQRGLPVGGRKADLMERLESALDEENVDDSDTTISSDRTGPTSSSGNGDDSLLLGILDEILEDVDDEDDEDDEELFNEPRSDLPSPLSEGDGENASARRARRKKYWQTQGVRELIKANNPTAATKAEEMISALEKMAEEEKNEEYLPGPVQYTMLIDAYAKRGTADDIQKAEEVIDRILESDAQSDGTAVISAQMLNSLMGAYANLGTVESAEKAMALLDRMEYLKNFGGSVKPTVHSYSIAISAWVKCESEQAAINAENILNRLFEEYDEVVRKSDEPADDLRPNNIVFNSAIDAWARSGSPKAGEKAEELLHRMEVLSHLDSYDVRPDTITFNTCIKAWCNTFREDAPLKAEAVLAKLETNPQYPKRMGGVLTVRPNRLSYNTVINAHARSSLPEAAVRAEGILLRMIKSFKSDTFATITPDCVTFASVLNALAKSKSVRYKAEKCASILKAMIELHEDDGSQDTRPNIICFNTVLNACAFSAHTSEEERRRALAVAVEVFNLMRRGKFVSPDAVSYGNMLKSVANLMPPGDQRNAMASRLFASCCDEGLVGGMCLDEIRRCIPPRAFLPLLADCGWDKPIRQRRTSHSVQLRDLPRAWTANVKRGDMKSRQRSFAKPEKKQERPRARREEKERPVFRRPRQVIEYGASGKDMM